MGRGAEDLQLLRIPQHEHRLQGLAGQLRLFESDESKLKISRFSPFIQQSTPPFSISMYEYICLDSKDTLKNVQFSKLFYIGWYPSCWRTSELGAGQLLSGGEGRLRQGCVYAARSAPSDPHSRLPGCPSGRCGPHHGCTLGCSDFDFFSHFEV